MIKIGLEKIVEQDFYLEDEREVARGLVSLGYELEPEDRIVETNPSLEKVKALQKLLSRAKVASETTVIIET
jgi:hypothetical protein